MGLETSMYGDDYGVPASNINELRVDLGIICSRADLPSEDVATNREFILWMAEIGYLGMWV
jgi:hypothetical protein